MHFMERFDQKIAFFFGARSLSKIVCIGASRKILGSVTKYGYLKKVRRGDILGRQGVESLTDQAPAPTTPPLNPPLLVTEYFIKN